MNTFSRNACLCLALALTMSCPLVAQETPVNLFLDCEYGCDFNYIRTEITCINYVNDRYSSNVYILLGREYTGSGGEKNLLYFTGSGFFSGMTDTLVFIRRVSDSDDTYRQQLVRVMKIGLVPYLYKSGKGSGLEVTISAPTDSSAENSTGNIKDPWNYWVFNVGAYMSANKDDFVSYFSSSVNMSASRITEKLKVNAYLYGSFRQNSYTYEGDRSVFYNNGTGAYFTSVFSMTDRLSAGVSASTGTSTFSNYKLRADFMPALEFSFFPYKDAVRRSLTLGYRLGPSFNKYIDTSYYGATREEVYSQYLSLNSGFRQKWGNLYLSCGWQNYLNTFHLEGKTISGWAVNSLYGNSSVELHVFKGLSLSLSGYISYTQGIYPQIPRKDFTRDELMTNSRIYPAQLSMSYYISISYTFGSMYNNVVNPRLNSL
ncbi:MAG: hypothetical protein U0T82_01415 [Bacteroidales bacterium]